MRHSRKCHFLSQLDILYRVEAHGAATGYESSDFLSQLDTLYQVEGHEAATRYIVSSWGTWDFYSIHCIELRDMRLLLDILYRVGRESGSTRYNVSSWDPNSIHCIEFVAYEAATRYNVTMYRVGALTLYIVSSLRHMTLLLWYNVSSKGPNWIHCVELREKVAQLDTMYRVAASFASTKCKRPYS